MGTSSGSHALGRAHVLARQLGERLDLAEARLLGGEGGGGREGEEEEEGEEDEGPEGETRGHGRDFDDPFFQTLYLFKV